MNNTESELKVQSPTKQEKQAQSDRDKARNWENHVKQRELDGGSTSQRSLGRDKDKQADRRDRKTDRGGRGRSPDRRPDDRSRNKTEDRARTEDRGK